MSDGRTHTAATLGAAFAIGAGYSLAYITNDPLPVGIVILGTLTGVFIGPDQDVDAGNISDYHIRKLFKIDWLWNLFWLSYRLSFKHRSFWSHGPVISTLIRILYLICPLLAILFKDQPTSLLKVIPLAIIAQAFALPLLSAIITWPEYFLQYGVYFFIGLLVSDLLHFVFDHVG